MATGSYEGYLLMEGIPGHHEASCSRAAFTGDLGALPHPPTRVSLPKAAVTVIMQLPRRQERREGERGGATGVSEARSHPHRGKTTPTLHVQGREAEA